MANHMGSTNINKIPVFFQINTQVLVGLAHPLKALSSHNLVISLLTSTVTTKSYVHNLYGIPCLLCNVPTLA